MPELKLFKVPDAEGVTATEVAAEAVLLERELQDMIEHNMEAFFGVRFLKSEYAINSGRMDSIGIDENGSPVIFEYKRTISENVINQGLFYLDWLLDHKADFGLLVLKTLGDKVYDSIDWSAPCVICVANDFSKYDLHAVNQMQRNIKLVKYRRYKDENLILFEHLNVPVVSGSSQSNDVPVSKGPVQKSHVEKLMTLDVTLKKIYEALCGYIEGLGDDLTKNQLKLYLAYRRVKNLFCIEVYSKQIIVRTKLDPDTVDIEPDFTKDTRSIGHYGTGDLEIIIKSETDLEKAKPLLDRAYNEA